MIRVAIAEDHLEMRAVLRLLLQRSSDVMLIAEAKNGCEALQIVAEQALDVLVMDIHMPQLNGLEAAKQIAKLPQPCRIILMSTQQKLGRYKQLREGVHGFIPKEDLVNSLVKAIQIVHQGETYFPDFG